MTAPTAPIGLTVGPLQYWWPRGAMMAFYAEVADSAAQTVVLGEVVCSRRNEFGHDDWLALARELRTAGKTVVLATQPLVMSEAELRTLRRIAEQDEFAVEAGDAAALQSLARAHARQPARPPFVIGPHVNVYSRAALVEHASFGAGRWVAPVELALDAVARINPVAAPVAGRHGSVATEVFGFGRMPLAFSARCFTARHHRLSKDGCEFRCRDDADGLLLNSAPWPAGPAVPRGELSSPAKPDLLRSEDRQPFLVLNGIQTQSAALHCLIDQAPALRAAGVTSLRLSPCSQGTGEVLRLFDAVLNRGASAAQARAEMATLSLPGALVDGYARRHPGMEALCT